MKFNLFKNINEQFRKIPLELIYKKKREKGRLFPDESQEEEEEEELKVQPSRSDQVNCRLLNNSSLTQLNALQGINPSSYTTSILRKSITTPTTMKILDKKSLFDSIRLMISFPIQ